MVFQVGSEPIADMNKVLVRTKRPPSGGFFVSRPAHSILDVPNVASVDLVQDLMAFLTRDEKV